VAEDLWGHGFDSAYAVLQTSDGGYIVAGNTRSFGAGDQDAWILKLDADGGITWQKTYGGRHSITPTSSSRPPTEDTSFWGYAVFRGRQPGCMDLKLDGNGSITWQKTYGGTLLENVTFIQQTNPDGGYIVAGTSTTFGAGAQDVWLLKLTPNGDVTWQNTYGGTAGDYGYAIQQTSDGGISWPGNTLFRRRQL